jgi:hypothetical protein
MYVFMLIGAINLSLKKTDEKFSGYRPFEDRGTANSTYLTGGGVGP